MARQDLTSISAEAALGGILALLVEARESRVRDERGYEKVEVLLDRAGLGAEEIASVTNKSTGAIKKSIQRARKG